MLAVRTSVVEPLPRQITPVYEAMLPRQPLRFLLAGDPDAGKTIMAGLPPSPVWRCPASCSAICIAGSTPSGAPGNGLVESNTTWGQVALFAFNKCMRETRPPAGSALPVGMVVTMAAPLDPTVGDLVILKGGIVGRILGLQVTGRCLRAWEGGDQRKGRVLAQTWYPIEGWRLVPFDHVLDSATIRPLGRPHP